MLEARTSPETHDTPLTPGRLARKVLGPVFPVVGRMYRRFGVDLEQVSAVVPVLPPGSRILDIGGGDGDLLNLILPRNPGVSVVMLDLSPTVGAWLDPELRDRVEILPSTSLREFASSMTAAPELVLLSDVVHHIPVGARDEFLEDLKLVIGPGVRLVIKEVEPGGIRSHLLYLMDRYISGDKNVQFLSRAELIGLVKSHLPVGSVTETGLLRKNPPNYALIFEF